MKQSGFTLLEIMVVVLLISLTVSIAMVNFRHDSSQLVETEARRFVALVEQMCQDSVIQGSLLALMAEGATAYRFVIFENGGWQKIVQDDIFRLRQLPNDISIDLQIQESGHSENSAYLRCEPDGFMTPFSAVFELEKVRYQVVTNEMREMEIKTAE
jgi:general secretion pathway protein H